MDKLTLEKLNLINDVKLALDWSDTHWVPYPKKIHKPQLAPDHTSSEVEGYLVKLRAYERHEREYIEAFKKSHSHNSEVEMVIIEFVKQASGFYNIPEICQEEVFLKAKKETSVSDGYYGIYLTLKSLVEIF